MNWGWGNGVARLCVQTRFSPLQYLLLFFILPFYLSSLPLIIQRRPFFGFFIQSHLGRMPVPLGLGFRYVTLYPSTLRIHLSLFFFLITRFYNYHLLRKFWELCALQETFWNHAFGVRETMRSLLSTRAENIQK